jgi:polysaccharide pyruvyl transferase WcaK-like protein
MRLQRNSGSRSDSDTIMTLDHLGCTRRADGGSSLRVLIDPSGYLCRNIGDTAMLQVALSRVRAYWPRAAIQLHSLDSESVRVLEPRLEVLNPSGALAWSAVATLGWSSATRLGPGFRRSWPKLMKMVAAAALLAKRRNPRLIDDYLTAVRRANLVLMSGAGSLNDSFKRHALCRLETLELAMDRVAVTALVGQGIGPMRNSVLRGQAARVLPKVDFIALRDGIDSLMLLNDIGVSASRVNVTGDDAVELAYRARANSCGNAIGVNFRVASYSGVDESMASGIGDVVRAAAARLGASLQPLPVSSYAEEDDLRMAKLVLQESLDVESGRASTPPEFLLALPKCRIVVSGSYHAAVFALSMGIPAVGIAGCDYYVHKFRGLADQFGPACQVELTSHPHFHTRLQAAIEAAWQSAPVARQSLLRAAVRQVAQGRAAYRRLFDLVEGRAAHAR